MHGQKSLTNKPEKTDSQFVAKIKVSKINDDSIVNRSFCSVIAGALAKVKFLKISHIAGTNSISQGEPCSQPANEGLARAWE